MVTHAQLKRLGFVKVYTQTYGVKKQKHIGWNYDDDVKFTNEELNNMSIQTLIHYCLASNRKIIMSWKMINAKLFIKEENGYKIKVFPSMGYWAWKIIKDDIVVDNAYRYSPTHDELSAKNQADKHLKKIIENERTG